MNKRMVLLNPVTYYFFKLIVYLQKFAKRDTKSVSPDKGRGIDEETAPPQINENEIRSLSNLDHRTAPLKNDLLPDNINEVAVINKNDQKTEGEESDENLQKESKEDQNHL